MGFASAKYQRISDISGKENKITLPKKTLLSGQIRNPQISNLQYLKSNSSNCKAFEKQPPPSHWSALHLDLSTVLSPLLYNLPPHLLQVGLFFRCVYSLITFAHAFVLSF